MVMCASVLSIMCFPMLVSIYKHEMDVNFQINMIHIVIESQMQLGILLVRMEFKEYNK